MSFARAAASVLDPMSFRGRAREELARIAQSGGFLSIAILGGRKDRTGTEQMRARMARLAERLSLRTRAQDFLTWRGTTIALLMPATNAAQAQSAARRLLVLVAGEETGVPAEDAASAGVATVFGDLEGGADALIGAAEEALRDASPGGVGVSVALDGRPRVLVVDDDATFAESLADTVSSLGWVAHPCSHFYDAIARLDTDEYSAVFVDLMLPGSSGLDVLRRSLATHPERPAVLMSGMDAQHDAVLDALSLGPVTFVRKPMATADVDAALRMFRDVLPAAEVR